MTNALDRLNRLADRWTPRIVVSVIAAAFILSYAALLALLVVSGVQAAGALCGVDFWGTRLSRIRPGVKRPGLIPKGRSSALSLAPERRFVNLPLATLIRVGFLRKSFFAYGL